MAEPLRFYADVAALQAEGPAATLARLGDLVASRGPAVLKQAALELDWDQPHAKASYATGEDMSSPRSFFARVLLQLDGPCKGTHGPPQVGTLRSEGDGTALSLACSLCFEARPFPRGQCPACGMEERGKIARFAAAELPQVEVRACDACRRYVNVVRLDVEPDAIPDVDEMAAVTLDLRARELGYEKICPNLIGI